jgi:Uma2 family endonuclease
MSPSGNHEIIKRRLAALFDAYLDHVGIQYEGVGAWLLKNADRSAGLEPDECYMLGEIGKSRPDLAIEVIWTSGSIDKLKIYQRLGVPEVWFWKHDVVHVYFLTDTGYERQPSSRLVPGFPFDVFPEVLELQTLSDVRKWLRERFPPK